jgi:tRNA-2-methylthio-N6-dimethylallyladenosine synthase
MLLGQKVNAYHHGDLCFADLIEKLDTVPGLERLRFTSPHPRHMNERLIGLFGELGCLCESIHLPVQSGSSRTLERMGRRYTAEFYREVVNDLREKCPDIMISTDLIVGYPGETEEDFLKTIELLKDVRFSGVFSFKYSPRPGTVAAELSDDVEDEEKRCRLKLVHEVTTGIENEIRASFIGSTLEVLVEREGRFPNQYTGRARNSQIVNFMMPSGVKLEDVRGDLVEVEIVRSLPHCLEGALT